MTRGPTFPQGLKSCPDTCLESARSLSLLSKSIVKTAIKFFKNHMRRTLIFLWQRTVKEVRTRFIRALVAVAILGVLPAVLAFSSLAPPGGFTWLPSSKQLLEPAPGEPQKLNSFPVTMALNPDGKFLAVLNAGYGTAESKFQQSITILNLESNQVADFPDARLGLHAHQSYFEGLVFSKGGSKLYASLGSVTDPEGSKQGDTGNGISVYSFAEGKIAPLKVIAVPSRAFNGHK